MKAQNLVGASNGNRNYAGRRRAKLARAVAGVALGLIVASTAKADLWWDTDGATAGGSSGTTANGNWGVSNFWSTSSAGSAATTAWTQGENAFFSAGTDVTGASTITVTGIGATAQNANNITIEEGTYTFNGGEILLGGGAGGGVFRTPNNVTVNSIISGSSGLNKLGAGTLFLTGANTYSGTTLIGDPVPAALTPTVVAQPSAGVIQISNNLALGTSDVNFVRTRLNGATLQDAYTGRLYLTNNITVANNITLTNGSGNAQGPGQLDNLSGDNTWAGNIVLNGQVQNLGNGLATIGAQGGTLRITGVMSNGTAGFPAWAKVGPGTVVITGNSGNNIYTGLTRVFGGTLIAEKDQAFGTSGGGVFMNLTSIFPVTVGFRAPATSPAGFTYNSGDIISTAGFPHDNLGQGLVHNFSGDNVYTGNAAAGQSVVLANTRPTLSGSPLFPGLPGMGGFQYPNTVSAAAGSSIEFKQPMVNSGTADPRTFQKFGGGNVIFSGANINVGPALITEGPVTFAGNGGWVPNSGIAFSSMMSVSPAATLRFDNSVTVKTTRFGTAVPVNIEAGTFELIGNAGADTLQGTVGGGLNAIGDAAFTVTNPGTATTSLGTPANDFNPVFSAFNRIDRATALLRGTSLGTAATGVSQIFLDPSLSTNVGESGGTGTRIGILPFATGDASGTAAGATGFVTYDVNGVRHLDEATEYQPGIISGGSDLVNASVGLPQAVLANTTVNSLRLTSGGTPVDIGPLATLTINSGAVLNAATTPAAITNGSLDFGFAEGVITTAGDLNISSVIKGGNGVTKAGRGTLTLAADNQFSGPLTVNGGKVAFTSETQLGLGSVVLAGGYLQPQGTQAISTHGVTLSSLYTGVNVNDGETLTINTTIDGTGALTKTGPGTLVLTGSNNFQSGINFKEGVVSISSDGQLGSPAPIAFDGGTLRITSNMTIASNRPIYLSGNNGTFDVPAGTIATSAAYIIGGGSLIKKGGGTLNFQGAIAQSTYIGNTQITDGTLEYTGTNGLGYAPPVLVPDYWVISNGATLQSGFTSTGTAGISSATRGITIIGAGKMDVNSDPNTGIPNIWTYNAVITGTGTLTKTGTGELRLATANTYNGKTTIAGGTLSINADNRLGAVVNATDSISIDGATLAITSGATAFTLNASRGITLTSNGGIFKAPTGTQLTIGGVIRGDGSVTKTDSGIIVLSGANLYTGPTNIELGLLRVNGSIGAGLVTVKPSSTLGGTGTVNGQVNVLPSGHIAAGASVGTLKVNGLSLDTANVDVEGDATGFDRINVLSADQFTLTGNSSVNVSGSFANGGEFVIIDYAGSPLADISGLTLSNTVVNGLNLSLYHDIPNTQIKLRVGAPGPNQWSQDADGSWTDVSKWTAFVVPNGAGDAANFLGKITSPRTVALDGDKTVNQLNFDNANSYTIAPGTGGSLTIANGTISVAQGTHIINVPVILPNNTNAQINAGTLRVSGGLSLGAGQTLFKSGAGALEIGGAQSHGAGAAVSISQGTVALNTDAGTAATASTAAVANLAVQFVGGTDTKLILGSHQETGDITINTADAGLQGIDLNSPATDGGYHGLRIYSSNVDATRAAMWAAIKNARTNPGDGIYDSGLHAGSAIGVVTNKDAHNDSSVFIRSTRPGDLNLDGSVTIADFIDLASNFNQSGPNITWQEGDINYDGSVTIADFIDLAGNFNQAYSGNSSSGDVQLLASFAASIGVDPSIIGSAVPEPATISLLAIGAMGLMARRRRR